MSEKRVDNVKTPTGNDPAEAADSQVQMHPPSQVPGYELQSFLGRGAYGEVWSARD